MLRPAEHPSNPAQAEPAMQSRSKKNLKRLAVLAVALLMACFLAEGIVLLFLGEQVKFPRHVVGADFGLRINQPSSRYRHKSPDVCVWFRINSKGMRADREYPYEKPPGVRRILSLGDSFTIGYEVDVEDCFSSVLERTLREKGFNVEVINAGVSGYSTAEECLYLERELLKYDPDIVLVSFYRNDMQDNVRTNLFRLVDGSLEESASEYVPLGRWGDFLNTNPVLAFLSGYSNAFAFLKENTSLQLKRSRVQEYRREAREETEKKEVGSYMRRLTAAIFQRIYADLHGHGIPLVIHSIPSLDDEGTVRLIGSFPNKNFDLTQEGVGFVDSKELLKPYLEKEHLYWVRSHRHWTPFSHEIAGKALAEEIIEQGFLE